MNSVKTAEKTNMSYQDLNIHCRINAKNNAEILYVTLNPKLRNRLPYGNLLLKRVARHHPGMFNPSMMMKSY